MLNKVNKKNMVFQASETRGDFNIMLVMNSFYWYKVLYNPTYYLSLGVLSDRNYLILHTFLTFCFLFISAYLPG